MAILLFMICAVLGGIILASATAAGGRVSNLAEADKRYYAVTSASQLLAEELSRKQVVIERTRTYNEFTDAAGAPVAAPAGYPAAGSTIYTVKTIESKNQGANFASYSYLAQAANYLLFGDEADTLTEEEKWDATYSDVQLEVDDETDTVDIIDDTKQDFEMKLYSDAGAVLCTVQCHPFVQTDGTLVIQIVNNDPENPYKLRLVMKPDYTETQIDETENSVPVAVAGSEEGTVFMTRKTVTKTSTISWALSNVKKME